MPIEETPFKTLFSAAFRPNRKGHTVRGFARLAGCSPGHVSDCKIGRSAPDQTEAEAWADLLRIEDRSAWLQAAATARARLTSTGRDGAAVYESRILALESERAELARKLVKLSAEVTRLRAQIANLRAQRDELITLAREADSQIPQSLVQ